MRSCPSLVLRLWRSSPWTGNPLMRPSDRVEAAIRILAVVVVMAAVPLCAAMATARYTEAAAQLRAENTAKTPVTATIITEPVHTPTVAMEVSSDRYEATVQWVHNGRPNHATTTVSDTARRGEPVTVWLGPGGHMTTAPPPADTAAIRGIGAGVSAFVVICCGAGGTVFATSWLCGARNRAGWAREWRMISRPRETR